ncbi:DDE superfamily endonuclease domain-containing protein [Hirsutella rhossiliensis]|uniref:DDE superfamily endonuclease domain-containing protein n=1 Tax=Hirsutella rhossiliensis TaxID=111463 RepID=A0A9P8MND4_9HYPO|nr:DDE superfamily endonuclease domain-containing protein [Hirsutella rhossiliensis]KAH0957176.1 DDE superfamily endonuclease domain-containing protein [Hirsutella rhossiliensis]
MASSKAKESAVQKWIDSATGLPNFSRHTTANLETRTIAGAELYYEGFYGSIVAAAKALGVPYKRLYYRVNGHHSTAENGGNRTLLDPSDEEEVFCWAHRRITQGHHIQGRALQQHANAILKAKGVGATASRAWAKRFIQRHRELFHRRRAAARDIKRKAMQDRIHNTWNFDETGFMVGYLHKGTFIWTFREIDTPILSDAHETVSVTAIEAISAAGSCIPSFVILPGVQIPARWVSNSLDDDTIISTSQKGYINDVIAIEWIRHFEKHTRPVDPLQKRLLLMDSCDNHYTEEMVHFCFDHNIKVFPMPPHLTHQLQPLDVGVFRSYKHWHQQVLHREIADGAYYFNKSDFLYHLQEVRTRTFKKHTILSSWQKCGLFPFNPEIVLSQLQDTLSSLTEEVAIKDLPGSIESEPQGGPQAARPSTPSPHTPPSIQRFNWNNVSTPRLNLSTIQRYHAYVQLRLATSVDFDSSVTYVYEKARKADKTLALNGITATAEMTKIKEKQAKRSSLQQQTTISPETNTIDKRQEEEAQRVRNKEVRDEAGYIRRWLRKVRFNVRISITEARIRDIRGLWAKGDKRAHLNCNEWMCASYRILRELHNRGVGQSKAIMWPEYYDREIVKEAAELVVMEANKRAICRQTLSLEADGIEMR